MLTTVDPSSSNARTASAEQRGRTHEILGELLAIARRDLEMPDEVYPDHIERCGIQRLREAEWCELRGAERICMRASTHAGTSSANQAGVHLGLPGASTLAAVTAVWEHLAGRAGEMPPFLPCVPCPWLLNDQGRQGDLV